MTSKYQYNNNAWHTVRIARQQAMGSLVIDGSDSVEGTSGGNTRVMTLQPPYSFGGVENKKNMNRNTGIDVLDEYRGCIRNIQVNSQPLGAPHAEAGVIPCDDEFEDGIYFNGGHVRVQTKQLQMNFSSNKSTKFVLYLLFIFIQIVV